jgi:hypothetical protein
MKLSFKEWLDLQEVGGAGVTRGRPGKTGQYAGFPAWRGQLFGPSANLPGAPGYEEPEKIMWPHQMLAPAFFTGIGQDFLQATRLQPQAFPRWPAVPGALEKAPYKFETDDYSFPLIIPITGKEGADPDSDPDEYEEHLRLLKMSMKDINRAERKYKENPQEFWKLYRSPDPEDYYEIEMAKKFTEKLLEKALWNRLLDRGLTNTVSFEKWKDNSVLKIVQHSDGKPYLVAAVRYPKKKYEKDEEN